MLLLDVTHTSHTRAHTGIQRVCRSLAAELSAAGPVTPVCFDPYQHAWRPLNRAELATLANTSGEAGSRGARWSLPARLLGHARRYSGRRPSLPPADLLLCPELFSARTAARLPELFTVVRGPRVAVFHDAIGLKLPELTPPATVARLPAYLRELAAFDGVAAVSEDSAASLRDYWTWLGLQNPPPVTAIPLGLDPIPGLVETTRPPGGPRILCVATLEGRKNHVALLDAAEALWREGLAFELELIGLARAETAAPALARIAALRAAGRPVQHHGSVSDSALHAAYARCDFTVYPSLHEGFGLPVLESLQHGKPCVCAPAGALAESARGGGCLVVPAPDARHLTEALRDLLRSPAQLAALAAAARARTYRPWRDYARDLVDWARALPHRG